MPVLCKDFLDIQAIIECGFTLKRICDIIKAYSYNWILCNQAMLKFLQNHRKKSFDIRKITNTVISHDRLLAIFHHTFYLIVLEIIPRPDIDSKLKPLTKLTSSGRSIEFKDILPWNIFQMIMKTILVSLGIVISYAIKQGISLRLMESQWEKMLTWLPTWKAKSLYRVGTFLPTWFFCATSKIQNYQHKTGEKPLYPSKYVLTTCF